MASTAQILAPAQTALPSPAPLAPAQTALPSPAPLAEAQPLRACHPASPVTDPFSGMRMTILHLVTDAAVVWMAVATTLQLNASRLSDTGRLLIVFAALTTLVRLARRGLYGRRPESMGVLDAAREMLRGSAWATAAALAVSALAAQGPVATRALMTSWVLASTGLVTGRVMLSLARRRARLSGISGRRTLILGAGFVGTQLEHRMRTHPDIGMVPVGFLDSDPAYDPTGQRGPILGTPQDLERVVAETRAQHVAIAFSNAPDSEVLPVIRRCEELGLEVTVVPRLFENAADRRWVEHVGGVPLCGLRKVNGRGLEFTVKHALDRSVAAVLTVLASPLLLGLAAAVRLSSPGPVLYRQRRTGRDGQTFDILKFRSMKLEPPAVSADPDNGMPVAPAVAGPSGRTSAAPTITAPGGVEGADRRTRVGAFMRRTSLDELPQLLNVLLGHMSLVGPRPERPEFVALFGDNVNRYGDRHRVKSGMTGWAQVHGLRGKTSLADRVEWDNWYIENWSLWLDLKIMLMTPQALRGDAGEGPATTVAAPTRRRRLRAADTGMSYLALD